MVSGEFVVNRWLVTAPTVKLWLLVKSRWPFTLAASVLTKLLPLRTKSPVPSNCKFSAVIVPALVPVTPWPATSSVKVRPLLLLGCCLTVNGALMAIAERPAIDGVPMSSVKSSRKVVALATVIRPVESFRPMVRLLKPGVALATNAG